MTATTAVLFDIDGTLVDSNYHQVDAWQLALDECGYRVEAWRIHRLIGMDSHSLLHELIGENADRDGDGLIELHSRHYGSHHDRLRPLPGAEAILRRLTENGTRVVLATSASPEELQVLMDVLGLTDGEITTTDSSDVDTAKPDPGIVQIALERAGAEPAQALFVGDSVWDVIAAKKAGVGTVAVRTGGIGADELIGAGALEVVDGVAELLTHTTQPWRIE